MALPRGARHLIEIKFLSGILGKSTPVEIQRALTAVPKQNGRRSMLAPPESERAASAKAAPEIAQSEQQQQRTYILPVEVQVFIAALLPLAFPLLCLLGGAAR
jgi:hypothetical protein